MIDGRLEGLTTRAGGIATDPRFFGGVCGKNDRRVAFFNENAGRDEEGGGKGRECEQNFVVSQSRDFLGNFRAFKKG